MKNYLLLTNKTASQITEISESYFTFEDGTTFKKFKLKEQRDVEIGDYVVGTYNFKTDLMEYVVVQKEPFVSHYIPAELIKNIYPNVWYNV